MRVQVLSDGVSQVAPPRQHPSRDWIPNICWWQTAAERVVFISALAMPRLSTQAQHALLSPYAGMVATSSLIALRRCRFGQASVLACLTWSSLEPMDPVGCSPAGMAGSSHALTGSEYGRCRPTEHLGCFFTTTQNLDSFSKSDVRLSLTESAGGASLT